MNNTHGRDAFKKNKKSLQAISSVFNILPYKMQEYVFGCFQRTRGKLGIGMRYSLLKNLSKEIDDNVAVFPDVYLLNKKNLSIGYNVSIHPFVYIDSIGGVSIGNNVSIAEGTSIISFDHKYTNTDKPIKYQGIEKKPIIIEDNVWIGANCTILGGVTIKRGTVVAAGAVVKKSTNDFSVVAGVPAREIKTLK